MVRKYLPKDMEGFVHLYERYISPVSLVAGFFADNLILLRRVDLIRSNALLLFYLIICALGIIFTNLVAGGKIKNETLQRSAPVVFIVMQFAFGGLFSGYLSLYSRSASVAASWLFVLVLAGLLLGNERFMRFYHKFTFQISLYFTTIFSFLIFFLPVIFHSIGNIMFLISGAASLGVITLFLMLLRSLVPKIEKQNRTKTARSIAVIFIVFNVLYFNNLIPPLPLALKSAGVYHSITRTGDVYTLTKEPVPWYKSFLNYNTEFHVVEGDTAYVYTAIFAPSGLSTAVVDVWQKYDESQKSWETVGKISFSILGGRDGGYRGYSARENIEAGDWRVNVLTPSGRLIGRVSFTTVIVPAPIDLVTETQ
ncbi:MAG: hypothetical protein JWO50_350 [Candidatus Kaiserbacteria bacterium]|nr:hypothetical protein [Candidatus Kaiserbacteria bacterium]